MHDPADTMELPWQMSTPLKRHPLRAHSRILNIDYTAELPRYQADVPSSCAVHRFDHAGNRLLTRHCRLYISCALQGRPSRASKGSGCSLFRSACRRCARLMSLPSLFQTNVYVVYEPHMSQSLTGLGGYKGIRTQAIPSLLLTCVPSCSLSTNLQECQGGAAQEN